MSTKINTLNSRKKYLYKLLDSFDEKDFYAVKSFAEFLKKARKEGKNEILQVLVQAPYEDKELSEQTKKNLEKAEEDIKKGRYRPISKVMKDFGL